MTCTLAYSRGYIQDNFNLELECLSVEFSETLKTHSTTEPKKESDFPNSESQSQVRYVTPQTEAGAPGTPYDSIIPCLLSNFPFFLQHNT